MSVKVCAVLGTDEGQVSEQALKRFQEMKPDGSDDFGNEIIEGQADNTDHAVAITGQVLQALQTLPFMGTQKIVWLKGANFLGDDRVGGSERTKEAVEELRAVLTSGLDPNTFFLMSATAIDKRRVFFKYLKKEADLHLFDKIDVSKDGWEEAVARLVTEKCRGSGLTIEGEALDLFVQQVGEDTRQINSELEKLFLYLSPNTHITIEAVRTMIPMNRKGVIWEISRSIDKGDGERAIHLINAQLEKGEQPVTLLRAAIIPTLRNTFYAKLAMEDAGVRNADKRSFYSLLKRIGPAVSHVLPKKADGAVNGWGLANCASSASRNSLKKLQANLEACLKADKALVTTSVDQRMVLHRLVVEVV